MTPSFGNPVAQAIIRPPGSPSIYGNFRVTAAFGAIDKDHKTPHEGIDLGNQKCGDPVLAMADGVVSFAGLIGKARVVRIRHPQFPGCETGYAHLAASGVVRDQIVKRGQVIGSLGATGATACHLHGGCKVNGIEIDWWPLLDQNQEGEDMPGFKAVGPAIGTFTMPADGHALISPTDTKVSYPQPAGGTFRVYAALDLRDANDKPVDIGGTSPPLNNRDQVYLVDAPAFGAGAYALRGDGLFTPAPAPVLDCAPAVKSAVDAVSAAYEARITVIKVKVSAGAVDISDD